MHNRISIVPAVLFGIAISLVARAEQAPRRPATAPA